MSEKRFTIEESSLVEDGFFIKDNIGSFSFPTTKDNSSLVMYEKHLNELHETNEFMVVHKKYLRDTILIMKGYLEDDGVLTLETYEKIENFMYERFREDTK